MQRLRSKPHSLDNQLLARKQKLTAVLARTFDEKKRGIIIEKIADLDRAARINEWLQLPASKSPD